MTDNEELRTDAAGPYAHGVEVDDGWVEKQAREIMQDVDLGDDMPKASGRRRIGAVE